MNHYYLTKTRYRYVGISVLCAGLFSLTITPVSYAEHLYLSIVLSTVTILLGLVLVRSHGRLTVRPDGSAVQEEYVLNHTKLREVRFTPGMFDQVIVRRYSLFRNRGWNDRNELSFRYYIDLVGSAHEVSTEEFFDLDTAVDAGNALSIRLDAALDLRRLALTASAI